MIGMIGMTAMTNMTGMANDRCGHMATNQWSHGTQPQTQTSEAHPSTCTQHTSEALQQTS